MQIEIFQLIEGARQAKGLTIVIDVFRAFSLDCYLFDQGAKEIIAVGNIEDAYMLKNENSDYILIGERYERKPESFDFGNSPSHISGFDFTGKIIVHTTSAGTQGLVNATHADELLTGSFVNAPATIKYIKMQNPEFVSLVCMGYAAQYPTEEDTFCAHYIRNGLKGIKSNKASIMDIIKNTSAKRLFDPKNQAHSPESDFYLCTDIGKFNFVIRAVKHVDGFLHLERVDV
jgi:2-phosphosulfolactate phosphatase